MASYCEASYFYHHFFIHALLHLSDLLDLQEYFLLTFLHDRLDLLNDFEDYHWILSLLNAHNRQ